MPPRILPPLLCLFLLASCSRETGLNPSVNQGPEWIAGTGYIEPAGEMRRLVFQHAGVIGQVPVVIGQAVQTGEVLMRLRDGAERAELAEAEAALALARAEQAQLLAGVNPARLRAAEADVAHAQKTFERQSALRRTGTAPETDYDLAQTALRLREAERDALRESVREDDRAVAAARVRAAESRLARAQEQLEETVLRAPFDGTVLEILRREGEAAYGTMPEPVVLFADNSHLRVRAEVDEFSALKLKTGQAAEIKQRGAGSKTWRGKVTLVKTVMGRKTVFAQSATERRDLDVLQAFIELEPGTVLPLGLEVDVRVRAGEPTPPVSN